MLEDPGAAVRDEDCITSRSQRRINVGLWTVADHPGVGREQLVLRNHLTIGVGVLLGDDLDRGKIFLQSRAFDFAGLFGESAFGDEDQVMPRRQILQRFRHSRRGFRPDGRRWCGQSHEWFHGAPE